MTMTQRNTRQPNTIEPTSYLWRELFTEIRLPHNGTVIEVAPGYEPKIGNALALLGFHGIIFLIEPDEKAASHIRAIYQRILPKATVKTIPKRLQETKPGIDIPRGADALIASHPFDDMVMACIVNQTFFFSQEKQGGADVSRAIQKIYAALQNKDYRYGIKTTTTAWKQFIEKSGPNYFIASQYPSRMLMLKGLAQRQQSGFAVLKQLKHFYNNSLLQQYKRPLFGYKGDPKWWIVAKKPRDNVRGQPRAIERLGKSIFVPERARRLHPKEYDIVHIDTTYFENAEHAAARKHIRDFAIVLDTKSPLSQNTVLTYADRQKDTTGISLCGNRGSGRAVYYGNQFNILGVGRTTLCRSIVPSHSTGRLELIGAMRRIILSRWINYFTKRAPAHPVLIALKETARFKWHPNPIPLALLVRVDEGSLDRPSHVEQSPRIPVNFKKIITEYAKLDAEYFAYRIILGAWSTSNYSLDGHIIDLESASFVKYRGPYYTSTSKYPHNRFGYEGLGFLKILRQLAKIKNIKDTETENRFYQERRGHLGRCFLALLGIHETSASAFFSQYRNHIIRLSDQFELLAKKINAGTTELNLYEPIPDDEDPSLLDMSRLFKNLAKLYGSRYAEEKALRYLIRKTAVSRIQPGGTKASPNYGETFIQDHAVITRDQTDNFLYETKKFIHALFELLALLDREKCLGTKKDWDERLRAVNQNIPAMFKLHTTLKSLAESYRLGNMTPKTLGTEIEKLCGLPESGKRI